nr:MAG TPA: hypothetical protein [Bacteriophage sp.]
MKTYIHKQIGFWQIEDLPDSYLKGTTLEDYENGAYIALSGEQIAFREAHPEATQVEVFNMQIAVIVPTLEEAKQRKILDIRAYDRSCDVNTFFCNEVATWLSVEERTQWMCSLISARNRGDQMVTFPLMGKTFTIPVDIAFGLLDTLNGDADFRTNVTAAHITAVESLTTVEAVEAYDFKTGYPEFVQITLPTEGATV